MLRHASSVSFVTVNERGRRPISPTMATRYADALGVVEELADGNVPDDARAVVVPGAVANSTHAGLV